MRKRFAPVFGASIQRFGSGQEIPDPQPGDFILTHSNVWTSRLIWFGQGLRFFGKNRKYAYWTHTAIFVDERGDIIEALGKGVCRGHISKYKDIEYHVVRLGTTADGTDRQEAVTFAEWSLGEKYGCLTIVSIAIGLLTGGRLTFGYEGQVICSGLVARALERTEAIFDRSPTDIMPADLARYYNAEPLPAGPSSDPPGQGVAA